MLLLSDEMGRRSWLMFHVKLRRDMPWGYIGHSCHGTPSNLLQDHSLRSPAPHRHSAGFDQRLPPAALVDPAEELWMAFLPSCTHMFHVKPPRASSRPGGPVPARSQATLVPRETSQLTIHHVMSDVMVVDRTSLFHVEHRDGLAAALVSQGGSVRHMLIRPLRCCLCSSESSRASPGGCQYGRIPLSLLGLAHATAVT